jgi:hypothetical protein
VVFLTAVPILVVAFVIALFLREIPLATGAQRTLPRAEAPGLDEAAQVVQVSAQ